MKGIIRMRVDFELKFRMLKVLIGEWDIEGLKKLNQNIAFGS